MKNNNDINLRERVDAAKDKIGSQTFRVGGLSIRLTSTLMYIACLLCALFIWANVTEENTEITSRTFDDVAVVIEGESALAKNELAVYELLEKTVSVKVEGSKSRVDSLKDDDIVAYVKVGDISEAGNVRLSVGVKGVGKLDTVVSPSSVRAFVDETDIKDVPVNIAPTYSIISDYKHALSSNIETVTVSGAKSIVDKIAQAKVAPELGDLVTSVTASAPIALVDSEGVEVVSDYITSSVSTVVIKAEVFTEKTVPLTYSFKHGYIYDKNIKVVLSPSQITLRGDPGVLLGIESLHLTEIDETKVSGNTEMFVGLKLPSGVSDVDQNSGFNVSIELLKYERASISIPASSVIFKNASENIPTLAGDTFTFEYIVDSASKGKVKAENFTVEIDLSALDANNRALPSVNVGDVGFTLYPINLTKVQLNLGGAN